jgi:quinol monooxygenase YgiN
MIYRIVKMSFQPDKTDDFIRLVSAIHKDIAAFDGCKKVLILRDVSDKNIFFTYSLWENESSLENYRRSDFFKTVWTKTKILFSDKPKAWSTQVLFSA